MKAWWIFLVENFLGFKKRVAVLASSVTEGRKIIEERMPEFPREVIFVKCSDTMPEDCEIL